jgi:hypothetical protein
MADSIHNFEFDQPIGQEPQGPSRTTLWWVAAGQSDYVCFLPTIQLSRIARTRTLSKGRLQAFFRKTLAQVLDGRPVHADLGSNVFILVPIVDGE